MDEQVGNENPNPQSDQPAVPEVIKPKINYWKIATIGLILLLIISGLFYVTVAGKSSILTSGKLPQPTIEPSVRPTEKPSDELILPNQLRIGALGLNLANGWIPIFATPKESKNIIYVASTQDEAKTLLPCAQDASCTGYALKLEDLSNTAVWQNYTVPDFIKRVKPEIKIDQLTKTTLGGREAWSGYIDNGKLVHQTVVVVGSPQSQSFVAITAMASEKGRQMLEQYVKNLSDVVIHDNKQIKPNELSIKRGFIAEITSSLQSQDYFLLSMILDSLLAPQQSRQTYHYVLLTESTKSSNGKIGGPNYPKGNYLNSTYYLLTDNSTLLHGLYGTPQIQIKLSSSSTSNIENYLADPKYCRADADCQYRASFCTIGAFNPYHQFYSPWGCGPAELENLGNSEALATKMSCQKGVEVTYSSLSCVSNSCQTVNAQPVCKQ